MNGRWKKIGLGLSGVMCAGMLFSCVLTSEAEGDVSRGYCSHDHDKRVIVNEYDGIMSYDDSVHAYVHVYEKMCTVCLEKQDIITVLSTENHDIVEFWDSVENCWAEECGICGYTYYYH